jgi:hypothetical protein
VQLLESLGDLVWTGRLSDPWKGQSKLLRYRDDLGPE